MYEGPRIAGAVLMAIGVLMLVIGVVPVFDGGENPEPNLPVVGFGALFLLAGAFLATGCLKRLKTSVGKFGLEAEFERLPKIEQRELPSEVRRRREAHAEALPVPGRDAPAFNLVEAALALDTTPCADPLVPMYLLDKDYRILDWNRAFSLAFDRTMEGRRGMSVLEWTYFLDNYEQVLAHGVEVFADGDKLPVIDVEQIRYTSGRYGPIVATKRAYQVPNDDGSRLGWLVTLEPSFENTEVAVKYRLDLLRLIRMDLVWTEYALSYDRVLLNTEVYPKLLHTFLGEEGELRPIPDHARVLDLGAGTGNITKQLADPSRQRLIFALENNHAMLDVLQSKCKPYLRRDDAGPGVLAIKQDVGSLFGLHDDYFDFALLNNVAYSLDDPQACLRDVRRVLKPGGEVRVSGPQKKTNLDRLFRQIRRDLKAKSLFDDHREDYEEVERINYYSLAPMLYRWTVSDVEQMLLDAGFPEVIWRTDKAYAGQAMIVCAR